MERVPTMWLIAFRGEHSWCKCTYSVWALMVSLRILVVGVASGVFVTGFSPWPAAVVTAPALRTKAQSWMGFVITREHHNLVLVLKNFSSALANFITKDAWWWFHAFITHRIHFGRLSLSYGCLCLFLLFLSPKLSSLLLLVKPRPSAKAHSSPSFLNKLSTLDGRKGFPRIPLKGTCDHMDKHPYFAGKEKMRPRGVTRSEGAGKSQWTAGEVVAATPGGDSWPYFSYCTMLPLPS